MFWFMYKEILKAYTINSPEIVSLVDGRKDVRKNFQYLLCVKLLKLYVRSQGFAAFYDSVQDLFL